MTATSGSGFKLNGAVDPAQGVGTAELTASGLILGVRSGANRSVHVRSLPAGSTLLLYTDGLVETRTASLDEGITDLRRRLTEHRDLPLEKLLDALLSGHESSAHQDDVALLALRVP